MIVLVWAGFLAFTLLMAAIDLGVTQRRPHVMRLREALAWTLVWVVLALLFNVFVYYLYGRNWLGWADLHGRQLSGHQAAVQFFTGYLTEKSLSVDNLVVIAMIFTSLGVPLAAQRPVLVWGILGAIVLRGVMILAGAVLLARFWWMDYVFGALLLVAAGKMLAEREKEIDPGRNLLLRLARRVFPVSPAYEGNRFFTRSGGAWAMTPLLPALLLVEASDVMFAIDSIPAIFAITRDPFLVFTSNVFAILGLRALYFALAGLMERFRYLRASLVTLLLFIGMKMLLSHAYPISTLASLAIICGILGAGVAATLAHRWNNAAPGRLSVSHVSRGLLRTTYRQARRIVVLVIGGTAVLLGLAMLILPGPGIVTILLGLAILGLEFAWARRWLKRLHQTALNLSPRWRRPWGKNKREDAASSDRT